VCTRVILGFLFVSLFVSDATAQSRIRWQTSRVVRGLADRIGGVKADRQASAEPTEDTQDGSVLGTDNKAFQQHRDYGNKATFQPVPRNETQASEQAARAVSIDDVITMVGRGLSETTIEQYIGDNGVRTRLVVSDLIQLHDQGVNERIIHAMQIARVMQLPTIPVLQTPTTRPVHMSPSRRPTDLELHGPSVLTPPQNGTLQPQQ
jgi:hypothetical protein